jgi:orotate phosphoribosyltransferase
MNLYSVRIAEIALQLRAIKLNPTEPFTWASGYRMPIYNDNRLLLCSSEYRKLIAAGFADIIKNKNISLDVIAGTATAGIPHATTLADLLRLPLVYVRSSAKGHGLKNQVEGVLKEGQKTLVIEDLVSTGGSSVAAVESLRSAGGIVENCFSIFSYGLVQAKEMFEKANCKLDTLFEFPVLLEVATKNNYINEEQKGLLIEWQKDPFGWGDKNGFPRIVKD